MGLSSPTCNRSPAFQDCFSLQTLQELPASSSHPEPGWIFGKETNSLLEGEKRFQQNPVAKDKSKRNCCVPAQKLLESIFFVALQEEKQTWDLQHFTALTLLEKYLSFPLLVGIFFCSPNYCRFWLIRRMASEIHCFSSFSNDSQGFDTKPVWLKSGPMASLKIFLNLSTIPGWFSNLKQKPRSGKNCRF